MYAAGEDGEAGVAAGPGPVVEVGPAAGEVELAAGVLPHAAATVAASNAAATAAIPAIPARAGGACPLLGARW
ncbi:MAG: hypothetical protein ACRDY0_05195 [Acidimicrobiales bacterium]